MSIPISGPLTNEELDQAIAEAEKVVEMSGELLSLITAGQMLRFAKALREERDAHGRTRFALGEVQQKLTEQFDVNEKLRQNLRAMTGGDRA